MQSGEADAATLTISGFAFSELSVKAGTKVTVTNEDSSDHTVNVKGTSTDVTVPAGGTATFDAPDQPGSYDLSCDFHPAMSGTLTVTG
jgi:plastocyanin